MSCEHLLAGNLNVPRAIMPQLAGMPKPGSKAESLPRDPVFHGVDLSPLFWKYLQERGVRMEHYYDDPANLIATQRELNCEKVAKLAALAREGKLGEQCVWVTEDNHIVDAHHRWAAGMEVGEKRVPVTKVHLPTIAVLSAAKDFAREWGIA